MIKNLKIDSNTLAEHFIKHFTNIRSARASLKEMKTAYKDNKNNRWTVYVKAYNYDTNKLENKTNQELLTLQAKLTGVLDGRGVLTIKEEFEEKSSFEAQTAEVLDIENGSIAPVGTISKKKQLENAEREKDKDGMV